MTGESYGIISGDDAFQYPPCVDLELFPSAKQAQWNGNVIAPDMLPPTITVKQLINKGSCSGQDAGKYATLSIDGILACCDSDEKVSAREALLELFSTDCGTLEVDGNTFEHVRVKGVSVSSSSYITNVSYSITLEWVDPEYGTAFKIENPSSIISADEDDEKITVSHNVSASVSNFGECPDCTCDITEATEWVLGNISEECPKPATINFPKNPMSDTLNCPNIEESVDLANCTHSMTKTWFIYKNVVEPDDGDDNKNVTSTYCKTISEDRDQRQTITHSGTFTYNMSPSCEDPHDPKFMKVLETLLEKRLNKYEGYGADVDERSITKSENPPSIQWSITFLPDPVEDKRGKTIDEYCLSSSISGDGIVSITINGTLRANENYPFTTVSRNCKCEAVEEAWDPEKYFPLANEFYSRFRTYFSEDMIKILLGPCFERGSLNPNTEQENLREGKEDCSKNYSFTWSDKKELDREWDYTVNITDPIENVSIEPMLNLDQSGEPKFCVIKSNNFNDGRLSISGQKSQDCPDDPEWDVDSVARTLAENILPGVTLIELDQRCTTETSHEVGKKHPSQFSKNYRFEHELSCVDGRVSNAKDREGSDATVSRNQNLGSTKIDQTSHAKKKRSLD
ncbi:MAG: hypothetical protein EBY39_01865 [Flavobacteriia bacterium]|nr:hypothetical protein [Flavobacteriia bacterium]